MFVQFIHQSLPTFLARTLVNDDFHVKTVTLEGAEQMPAQFSVVTLLIDNVCRLPVLSLVVPFFCTQNYLVCIAGTIESPASLAAVDNLL